MQSENLDQFMYEIYGVYRLRRRFMTWYQIAFLPLTDLLVKWEERPRKNLWIEDSSDFERRLLKNAWLRNAVDQARTRVKYHMMPKTLQIRDDEAA